MNLLTRDSLYKRIAINSATACWEWQGCRTPDGYGIVTINYKTMRTHRLAMHLWHGHPLAGDLCVLHKCDNPPCCNPDHLFLGTIKDNVRDMYAKGRSGHQRGTLKTGILKLSDSQVMEILHLVQQDIPQKDVALRFGISRTHVCNINSGKDRTAIWRQFHGNDE